MKHLILNLFVTAWLLAAISCASRRSRYMASAGQEQASQHTQQRTTAHQSRRLTLDSRLDAHGYRETATIIPLGRFSYHPDSGYRGYAASVQLQHQDI